MLTNLSKERFQSKPKPPDALPADIMDVLDCTAGINVELKDLSSFQTLPTFSLSLICSCTQIKSVFKAEASVFK